MKTLHWKQWTQLHLFDVAMFLLEYGIWIEAGFCACLVLVQFFCDCPKSTVCAAAGRWTCLQLRAVAESILKQQTSRSR